MSILTSTLVTPNQQTTFFDSAIVQGALSSNLFTVDLKKGAPGTYDFGFIDDSKYTGDITYTPVDSSQGFWEFTGTGYAVGDGQFQSSSIDAIADTGTTLILIEDAIVEAYYNEVDGAQYESSQGGYTFDCSATLPDFTLGIGDYEAVVPGDYINFAPLQAGSSSKFLQLTLLNCHNMFQQLASVAFRAIRAWVFPFMVISSSRLSSLFSTATTCNSVLQLRICEMMV